MLTDPRLATLVRRDWLADGPLDSVVVPYIEALRRQIVVTGDDGIGVGGERAGDDLIIIGIAGYRGNMGGHDDLHRCHVIGQHRNRRTTNGR